MILTGEWDPVREGPMRGFSVTIGCLAALLAAIVAAPSQATFKGTNGLLVFQA